MACVEAAIDRAPAALKAQMEEYAELVLSGRSPGDDVRERTEQHGPLAVLEALARKGGGDA